MAWQVLSIGVTLPTAFLAGKLGLGMTLTSCLIAILGLLTSVTAVLMTLLRPRGGMPAVTLIVTLVELPISRPGTCVGRIAGLSLPLLQPGRKLIALPLTLVSSLFVSPLRWYLAQCTVVVPLLLTELKPFRLLTSGRCTEKLRVTCISVLQTVELLRGRHPFTMLLMTWVYPMQGWP